MAGDEDVEVSPPAISDSHKRKLDALEPETAPPLEQQAEEDNKAASLALGGWIDDGDNEVAVDDVAVDDVAVDDVAVDDVAVDDVAVNEVSDGSEPKRPRLDDVSEAQPGQNGHQIDNEDDGAEEKAETDENEQKLLPASEKHPTQEELRITENQPVDNLLTSSQNAETENLKKPSENNLSEPSVDAENFQNTSKNELSEPSVEAPEHHSIIPEQDVSDSGSETTSKKIEVPNNKVGVLIGKAGDTIRFLQYNSGAKIQITRDGDADPQAATRPVELIGTLESILKAEGLIKDVIAEADAGGSPALVARGFTTTMAAGAMEQVEIQVPNERVGLIIGKGGETIKNLQTRSGARIQLIPQHLPEGDQSKERTLRVCGDKQQIEAAKELVNEVMNQTVRPSTLQSNYGQQQFHRPRGQAGGTPQWRSRGGFQNPQPPRPYDYHQPRGGPYPSQNQPYPPYGSYHAHGPPPRGNFGPGWDQRPPAQGPHSHGGGYDSYYAGGHGGHAANIPPSAGHPPMGQNMPPSHSQPNYYGQPHPSSAYPQQAAPPHQPYGQGGYAETKYDNPAAQQPSYSGGITQPGPYPGAQGQGYPPQQQYRAPAAAYGAPPQAGPVAPQTYPTSQTGENHAQYQAPTLAPPQQSYGQSVQPYPYQSAGDAYAQSAQAAAGYSQPGGAPPVAGYAQQPHQAAGGYPQQGYGQYSQPQQQANYGNQTGSAIAGYGYPGQPDPSGYAAAGQSYNSGPVAPVQATYAQPGASQPVYDQSAAQQGPYAAPVQGSAPTGYGKTVSPKPGTGYAPQQYDATQMYGAAQ